MTINQPTPEQFERRAERLLNRAYHAKKNFSHYKEVAGDVGQLEKMEVTGQVAKLYSEKFHQEFITIMDCYMIMTGEGFTEAHTKLICYNLTMEDEIRGSFNDIAVGSNIEKIKHNSLYGKDSKEINYSELFNKKDVNEVNYSSLFETLKD
jgi:hypothetical protein